MERLYLGGLVVMAAWTVVTWLVLARMSAPYGRHVRGGWGPTMPTRWAWFVFELPAVALFLPLVLLGPRGGDAVPVALLALWAVHYVHRDIIYPLRLRPSAHRMPLVVVGAAFAFQVLNAGLNAIWIGWLGQYDASWFADPRFIIGAALFGAGFGINLWADAVLRRLRRRARGYVIPYGGLYRWVSCPNYLGECVEWLGWAVATWSWPGAAFALYTFSNLAPRALQHHRWYRSRFPDYPGGRRALIPGVL